MDPQKNTELLYERESYAIRRACFEVYKEMGPGFLETVYQECLAKEFTRQNIPFIAKQKLSLEYKGESLVQTYSPDFIGYNEIIIEINGIRQIAPEHQAQLLNYLKATGMKLGLLVNFFWSPSKSPNCKNGQVNLMGPRTLMYAEHAEARRKFRSWN